MTTTSNRRWDATVAPSTVCPIPTAHSYDDVKNAYNAAKKKMPGLTPAAWRKQAAIDLGLDYNTYLKIWKSGKGKGKLVATSTPTVSAAASQTTTMGIKEATKLPKAEKVDDLLDDLDYIEQQAEKGLFTYDEVNKMVDDVIAKSNASVKVAHKAHGLKIKYPKTATAKVAQAAEAVEEAVEDKIMTSLGVHLDQQLAKDIYSQIKKAMPGGTPATWRKAAAEYLEVDYKDYLKAWKVKPSGAAKKVAPKPITSPPITPSSAGKYAKSDITPDQLKDELAKLYGPGAKKEYINIDYLPDGGYITTIPTSLIPTQEGRAAIIKGLEKLGLKVEKSTTAANIIKVRGAQAKSQLAQIKATGTKTLPDGRVVLDLNSADHWTTQWWQKQATETKKAWQVYTGSGYRDINGYWRHGKTSYTSAESVRRYSKLISDSMPRTQHEFTVFRGTSISIDKFKVGRQWSDDGFMSTAVNPGGSWSGVKFEIICPKGTKGMYIGKKSSHPGENEFLIDKGTQFRVVGVDKVKNLVKLVAIPK